MELVEAPLVLMLAGLAAYAVLGGADFGAGFWQLLGDRSERAREIRDHAHRAMGPVWEANHVWLVFVLVVCWTAYPEAFASIASTLAVPLSIAGVGIVMRGTAYALRSGTRTPREQRMAEVALSLSSILTPFALGAAIGAVASGRVPVGNAEGDLLTSWLNPTSLLVGTLAVATAAYLAAVYLAADAVRLGRPELAGAYRLRGLVTAVVAGGVALGGLPVLRADAELVWDGLTSGAGLGAVLVSVTAGVATMALVWRGRYEPARVTAAAAVAAIVGGWALAQSPTFLPGLSVEEAAAGRSTIVAMLVSLGVGALVLVPSLALLFGLVVRGRFDAAISPTPTAAPPAAPSVPPHREPPRRLAHVAAGFGALGAGLVMLPHSSAAHVAGFGALLVFVAVGLAALVTPDGLLDSSDAQDEA